MDPSQLWLVRDKPRYDELMSSWIVRLAHLQRIKLESFCYRSWGRGAQIMTGDTDLYPHEVVIRKLALHTGASIEQVQATTFQPFAGMLFADIPSNGLTQWVTYFGSRKVLPRAQGLSFCPLCLAKDDEPYCRRIWRTAFATVCSVHKVRLLQNCPHCEAPFVIHRWDKGLKHAVSGNPITHCQSCRKNRVIGCRVDLVDSNPLSEFQWILERALLRGWVNVAGRPTDAYLFFSGLAMLSKMLLDRRRSDRVRAELSRQGFLETLCRHPTKRTRFECLDLELRHEIMQVLAWFFLEWPARFIEVCNVARFSSSYLFNQATGPVRDIPFWLWEPVHFSLDRTWYAPSDDEIDAVVAHLKRSGKRLRKIDVARTLGVSGLNKATLKRLAQEFARGDT